MTASRTVKAEEALEELVEAERRGDAAKAAVLRRALLRDEDDIGGHRRIAVALMHGGLIRKAIAAQVACVNAGTRRERRLADDENLLVAMMLMLGDARSAASLSRRIVEHWPDYMPGWENHAFALTQVGDVAGAALAYRRVLEAQPGKLNAMDGLARCLAGVEQHDEAVALGQRSLEAKAAAARALPRLWTMPAAPPPPFDASRPERNVIAYSLWGANPRYLVTAERNARIARDLYPGWTCRFYQDDTVPQASLAALCAAGAECVAMPRHLAMEGLMWRFLVAGDAGVDRFLVRDADSLLTVQERVAVDDWLASGKRFHLMRDWYSHTDLILAGLWDGTGGILTGIAARIAAYVGVNDRIDRKLDQRFLADIVWPSIHGDCLSHDSYFGCFDARPFPPWGRLPPGHHVGQNASVHGRKAT